MPKSIVVTEIVCPNNALKRHVFWFKKIKNSINRTVIAIFWSKQGLPAPVVRIELLLLTKRRSIVDAEFSVKCVGSSMHWARSN